MINLVLEKRNLVMNVRGLCAFENGVRVINGKTYGGVLFVPSGVRRISTNALRGMKGIKTVVVPKSVKYIEKNAFVGVKKVIFTETDLDKFEDRMCLENGWDNGIKDADFGDTVKTLFARVMLKLKD